MALKTKSGNKDVMLADIVKYIEKGKGFGTTLEQIGTKWNLPKTTFARYWKKANHTHSEAQQVIKDAKAAIDLEASIEERKSQIADVLEQKEILTAILRAGDPRRVVMVSTGKIDKDGNAETENVGPAPIEVRNSIAASAELSKMRGDYAPAKIAATDSKGNDIYEVTLKIL